MPQLTINIDREIDEEVIIVKCYIDGEKIADDYFLDTSLTNEYIESYVRSDLEAKGYEFD